MTYKDKAEMYGRMTMAAMPLSSPTATHVDNVYLLAMAAAHYGRLALTLDGHYAGLSRRMRLAMQYPAAYDRLARRQYSRNWRVDDDMLNDRYAG